jgi:hypothetical protein
MTKVSNDKRRDQELTTTELDTVNGGFLAGFIAAYAAGKILDKELNGEGFVATMAKKAQG